jgi:wobble nucleotide-excising tRNase
MSAKLKIYTYKSMQSLVVRIRDDLNGGGQNFVLIYAYNGTGKTRLSMEFKNAWSKKKNAERDTLYFNAFTEDLFTWDNDLENDNERILKLNSSSRFFSGLQELEMENRIRPFLARYVDFDFNIDYEKWEIKFSREVQVQVQGKPVIETIENIKISRGEENLFIWCFFLAIAQLAIDGAEAYKWVKYLYIDDPISSLDENNAIAVASDLGQLLIRSKDRIKTVISSHHSLFFNIMCNELKLQEHRQYFLYLHKNNKTHTHTLQATDGTPFFHHVAMLSELQKAAQTGQLYTYHFNTLRSILEKTASFFGMKDFSDCIEGVDDEVLYARALNLLSHGAYSIFEPREMGEDNKELFKRILTAFLKRYRFDLPELITDNQQAN